MVLAYCRLEVVAIEVIVSELLRNEASVAHPRLAATVWPLPPRQIWITPSCLVAESVAVFPVLNAGDATKVLKRLALGPLVCELFAIVNCFCVGEIGYGHVAEDLPLGRHRERGEHDAHEPRALVECVRRGRRGRRKVRDGKRRQEAARDGERYAPTARSCHMPYRNLDCAATGRRNQLARHT